jgi:hypothetical protein
MMNLRLIGVGLGYAILSAGCAHTPPVKVNYFLAQSEASFKVIRTVACDEGDNPVVASSVMPNVRHTADRKLGSQALPLAALRGAFSDTDVKFDFYEDGRLKGINASSTGQGESIFKSTISLLSLIAASGISRDNLSAECAKIKKWGGGKPLTITYEGGIDLAKDLEQLIPPEAGSAYYARELKNALGDVCAYVTQRGPSSTSVPGEYSPTEEHESLLTLRQPGRASISITAGPPGLCQTDRLWSGDIAVGQFGTSYALPIPRPAVFGKQVFAVSIAESGAITSLQYASNTGAGQLLGLTNSAWTAAQGTTDAQEAAALKAEADVIAAQQRLVQCRAKPDTCK